MLRNADGGVGVLDFPEKSIDDSERFNVISVTRGWVGGGPISRKKRYVTLEWPLTSNTCRCRGQVVSLV